MGTSSTETGHLRFSICGTCHDLYETAPQPGFATPQRCRCRKTDEPTWPRFDFNEHLRLCECCRSVPLRSGSRWSVWFCEGCKTRVRALNDRLGRYAIPIGRHSLMGGLGISGAEIAGADEARLTALCDAFAGRTQGLFAAMEHLSAFAAERTVFLAAAVGLDPTRDVRLTTWLDRLRPMTGSLPRTHGEEGAFEALVRWFGSF
jgi:hypothetical protein